MFLTLKINLSRSEAASLLDLEESKLTEEKYEVEVQVLENGQAPDEKLKISVNQAAKRWGMRPSQASQMLDAIGYPKMGEGTKKFVMTADLEGILRKWQFYKNGLSKEEGEEFLSSIDF